MYSSKFARLAPVVPVLFMSPALALCEEPSTAERIRGNYENKIRFFAAPEKIFETFANIREPDGGVFMSYKDFFHSLTPYNFVASADEDGDDDDDKSEEGKEEEKKKVPGYFDKFMPEIMTIVDANHDLKIDFNEYIFFITLLQLPEGEVLRVIERLSPEEKKVNKEQFGSELSMLRKTTALGSKQRNRSFMPDGRKITTDEETITACIIEHLFSGKEFITIGDFINLKTKLKTALLHYEFNQFEVDDKDTISCQDFAKSLLSCLNFNQATKFMRRIHSLNLEGRVTYREYVAFHNLIEKADIIKMKIGKFSHKFMNILSNGLIIAIYRYLSKSMFRELCDDFQKIDDYCKVNDVTISDAQIDTFMAVLDDDANGMLEYEEVVDVLEGNFYLI
jgi:hypothetical protein